MPATYTHHTFSKDIYKIIKDDIGKKIDEDIFYLFGKGFDILFFIKPKLGFYAHNNHVQSYFKNIIDYIRKNNLTNNKEVLAYLYGSICHYVLDSIVHPYIYYKTGKITKKDKKTYKYRGKHAYIEYMIDAIIYQERNNKPIYKANLAKEVFTNLKFSNDLKNIIHSIYLKTFLTDNGDKLVYKGYKNYHFIVKHIMSSKFGIKYYIYEFIDFINVFKTKKLANYCYYIKKIDKKVLNLEHKKWYYPTHKQISFHYSFYDLYDIAIEKAKKYIKDLDNALDKDEKEIKCVLNEIGNNSYYTGKNADKKYIMKYFEY